MSEFLHMLGDPAHWGFELVTDLVWTGVGACFMRVWVRSHDRKHHGR